MIPKIIHYIWVGNNEMPKEQVDFIKKWKKLCPDYVFMKWDKERFEAEFSHDDFFYKNEIDNYGFLSDYIRLKVLYKYGGIYMDTDVEMKKNFDSFLNGHMFLGYIFNCLLGTAVIGCEPNAKEILELFILMNEDYERTRKLTVSNNFFTKYFLTQKGFFLNGKECITENGCHVFPRFYFEKGKAWYQKKGGITRHWCNGSWRKTKRNVFVLIVRMLLGDHLISTIGNIHFTHINEFYPIYRKQKRK